MPSAAIRQRYHLMTPLAHSRRVTGRFAGIDGASPTSVWGDGFTVARTGEGVWVVTFAKPCAGFVSARAWANHPTDYHDVTYALDAAARTMTITHKASTYAAIATPPVAQDVVSEIGFDVTIAEADVIGAGV